MERQFTAADGAAFMTAEEGREVIREMMAMWDKCRAAWIEKFGNDTGFGDWFLRQVKDC